MGTCNGRIHIHGGCFPQNLSVRRRHDIVTEKKIHSVRMNSNCCHLDQETVFWLQHVFHEHKPRGKGEAGVTQRTTLRCRNSSTIKFGAVQERTCWPVRLLSSRATQGFSAGPTARAEDLVSGPRPFIFISYAPEAQIPHLQAGILVLGSIASQDNHGDWVICLNTISIKPDTEHLLYMH